MKSKCSKSYNTAEGMQDQIPSAQEGKLTRRLSLDFCSAWEHSFLAALLHVPALRAEKYVGKEFWIAQLQQLRPVNLLCTL